MGIAFPVRLYWQYRELQTFINIYIIPMKLSYSLQMQKYRPKQSNSSPHIRPPALPPIAPEPRFAFRSRAGSDLSHQVKTNQDSAIACKFSSFHFFAVCDGHGQNGHLVSGFLKKHLPRQLRTHLGESSTHSETIHQAIVKACARSNKDLCLSDIDTTLAGSTLVGVLLHDDLVYCISVGDSRAILCTRNMQSWSPIQISVTHHPQNPKERARIINSDGRISQAKAPDGSFQGPERVYLSYADTPGLAMTRSFGDKIAQKVGVMAEPDIVEFKRVRNHKFIVIASDGVWDQLTNEEVMEFIVPFYKDKQVELATERVVREAFNRWKAYSILRDDITCLVIFF